MYSALFFWKDLEKSSFSINLEFFENEYLAASLTIFSISAPEKFSDKFAICNKNSSSILLCP